MTPIPSSPSAIRSTPGTDNGAGHGSRQSYLIGYFAATLLTIASFAAAQTSFLTPSSVTSAITVLAIAQMLVHLIFFLHISTSPNQLVNIIAFAVTMFIVLLVVGGSLWIMSHLHANMMPVDEMMQMQP